MLSLIKVGGFYLIDDMIQQEEWPEGNYANIKKLIPKLKKRKVFIVTKMEW